MFRRSRTSRKTSLWTVHKICVVGDASVGKTTLRSAFLQKGFAHQDVTDPTNERLCVVGDRVAMVEVLDAGNHSLERVLREDCLKSGEGFILLFSITDRKSFLEIGRYRHEILRYKENGHCPMMLVANKTDLERDRAVTTAEAVRHSQELGMPYGECSAVSGVGVEEVFDTLLQHLKSTSDNGEPRRRQRCSIL